MGRSDFLYGSFRSHFRYEPTSCQDSHFRDVADFLTGDDGDILTVNGYAGTGKTTAVSAVIASMNEFKVPVVLLAPTGRAAKVLSLYSGRPASTIHKHIYSFGVIRDWQSSRRPRDVRPQRGRLPPDDDRGFRPAASCRA